MNWGLILLGAGFFTIGCACAAHALLRAGRMYISEISQIVDLRVALGTLVRACEGDTCTLESKPINAALAQAHEVLGR